MHTLTLSTKQVATIINALATVSPVGGGSAPYTLLREIRQRTGVDESNRAVIENIEQVVRDYFDAHGRPFDFTAQAE